MNRKGDTNPIKPCDKDSEIANSLGLPRVLISHFPSIETRTTEDDLLAIDQHQQMISFATRCIDQICEIIYPVNTSALKCAMSKNETKTENTMKEKMASITISLPRRCIERCTTLAILAGPGKRHEMFELIKKVADIKTNFLAYTGMKLDYETCVTKAN